MACSRDKSSLTSPRWKSCRSDTHYCVRVQPRYGNTRFNVGSMEYRCDYRRQRNCAPRTNSFSSPVLFLRYLFYPRLSICYDYLVTSTCSLLRFAFSFSPGIVTFRLAASRVRNLFRGILLLESTRTLARVLLLPLFGVR